MTTHSSVLCWDISWTGKPDRLQFMGLQKSQTQLSNYTTRRVVNTNIFFIKINLSHNSGKYLTSYSKILDKLNSINSRSVIPDTLILNKYGFTVRETQKIYTFLV